MELDFFLAYVITLAVLFTIIKEKKESLIVITLSFFPLLINSILILSILFNYSIGKLLSLVIDFLLLITIGGALTIIIKDKESFDVASLILVTTLLIISMIAEIFAIFNALLTLFLFFKAKRYKNMFFSVLALNILIIYLYILR